MCGVWCAPEQIYLFGRKCQEIIDVSPRSLSVVMVQFILKIASGLVERVMCIWDLMLTIQEDVIGEKKMKIK